MWASLSVGESNQLVNMGNDIMDTIASSLLSHPLVDERVAKSIASQSIIVEDSTPVN